MRPSTYVPYHQIIQHPLPGVTSVSDKVLARAKAIVGLLVPLVAVLVAQVADENITQWWLAIVAALTALGVYITPNKTMPA